MHRHDDLEANVVLAGEAEVCVDGRVQIFRAGQLWWLKARQGHMMLRASADFRLWVLLWSPASVRMLLRDPGGGLVGGADGDIGRAGGAGGGATGQAGRLACGTGGAVGGKRGWVSPAARRNVTRAGGVDGAGEGGRRRRGGGRSGLASGGGACAGVAGCGGAVGGGPV